MDTVEIKKMHKRRENITRAIFIIAVVAIILFGFFGCTDNARARAFGGTSTFTLAANNKVINITWKDTDLWILTRPMRVDEKPEIYTFTESSSLGMFNGTVIVKETK